MNEIREYHHYDDVSNSNSTAMFGIFIVALIALLAIGLAIWQPWVASPPSNDTTIIERSAPDAPDTTIVNPPSNNTIINPPDNNTTIVNPPTENKTEINIEPPTGTTGG